MGIYADEIRMSIIFQRPQIPPALQAAQRPA